MVHMSVDINLTAELQRVEKYLQQYYRNIRLHLGAFLTAILRAKSLESNNPR